MKRFDQIIERKATGCFKYDGLKMIYGRDDLLPLWVADMDFAVSDEIQAALKKRLEHPIFGYNFIGPEFADAVKNWQKNQYSYDSSESDVIAVPSVMTALAITVLTQSSRGDGILIQTPVYPPFHSVVKEHKRSLLTNSLINVGGRYEIDFEDFEAKAKEARIFILCNPHNPVGRVFGKEELSRMSEICQRHNVLIFSDEIHADIVYSPHRHIPMASLGGKHVITSFSPAKSFNLAGLATAVMVVQNPQLSQDLQNFNRALHTFMGNSFGIAALIAAYTESEGWLNELRAYLKANRDYVQQYLAKHLPDLVMSPCEGSYLAWLDMRAWQMSDDQLTHKMKDEAGLALNPGTVFGKEGSGFMRLNFACPRAVLEDALPLIYQAFRRH